MGVWITRLINLKTGLEIVKQLIKIARDVYEFYKVRKKINDQNNRTNKNLKALKDARKEVEEKKEQGQPVTKTDREKVRNAARKFGNDFGRI